MLLRPALAIQSLGGFAALIALALWPPRTGAMVIVALGGADRDAAAIAIAANARLLGAGPLPGSLVVDGDRSIIARHFGGKLAIILAAPADACGQVATS